MGDKPFLGLVVAFVPALGCIRVYKAKDFPRDLVAGLSLAAFCDSREHASFRSRGLVYANLCKKRNENLAVLGPGG
jgi:hypothetical protein